MLCIIFHYRYCSNHLNKINKAKAAAAAAGSGTSSASTPKQDAKPQSSRGSKAAAKTSATQAAVASSVDSSALTDIKLSIQDRLKTKFGLHQRYKDTKSSKMQRSLAKEDKGLDEDPYAFPDGEPVATSNHESVNLMVAKCLHNHVSSSASAASSSSVISSQHISSSGSNCTASSSATGADASSVHCTPISKLYPELLEKLCERKQTSGSSAGAATTASVGVASPGSKSSARNQTKTAQTLNKLQTKIAQNRIKDKLKRSQSVSSASSNQSSPDRKAGVSTAPVSPVITGLSASLTPSWPIAALQPSTSSVQVTTSSTSTPTMSSSSSSSSNLQSLVSQLPPLDQPLWSVQQQRQHGILPPANTTTTSTINSNLPTAVHTILGGSGSVSAASSLHLPLGLATSAMKNTVCSNVSPAVQNVLDRGSVAAGSAFNFPSDIAPVCSNVAAADATVVSATRSVMNPALTSPLSVSTPPIQISHLTSHQSAVTPSTATHLPLSSPSTMANIPPPPPYPGSPPRIPLQISTPLPNPSPKPTKPTPTRKPKKPKAKKDSATPNSQSSQQSSHSSSTPAIATSLSQQKQSCPPPSAITITSPRSWVPNFVKLQKPTGILTEKEARQTLKRHSAVKAYAYHANQVRLTSHLVPMGK